MPTMSTTHSRLYVAALAVWLAGGVALITLDATDQVEGVLPGVVIVCVFCANTVIGAIAWVRVQRGEVWREAQGFLLPVAAEFLLLQLGIRLPAAVASLRAS
jgi:hypothetical protein